MAIKHINQNAKEESGILLSGRDAKKVFAMFANDKPSKQIQRKKEKLESLFSKATKSKKSTIAHL